MSCAQPIVSRLHTELAMTRAQTDGGKPIVACGAFSVIVDFDSGRPGDDVSSGGPKGTVVLYGEIDGAGRVPLAVAYFDDNIHGPVPAFEVSGMGFSSYSIDVQSGAGLGGTEASSQAGTGIRIVVLPRDDGAPRLWVADACVDPPLGWSTPSGFPSGDIGGSWCDLASARAGDSPAGWKWYRTGGTGAGSTFFGRYTATGYSNADVVKASRGKLASVGAFLSPSATGTIYAQVHAASSAGALNVTTLYETLGALTAGSTSFFVLDGLPIPNGIVLALSTNAEGYTAPGGTWGHFLAKYR